jgi:osmotically-inducible protein OsmY
MRDEKIWNQLMELFAYHDELDSTDIEVTVHRGVVSLRGEVDSRFSRLLAEELAESLAGVDDVENFLQVSKNKEGFIDASLSGQDNLILKTPRWMEEE